ncbi:nitroreductase family deazaflavin-dependent oxidoreductase [Gordonia sp. NPDC003429]
MQLPRTLARFNKVVANPIQRQWAPRLAPWAMIEHTGRTSGKAYSTPVLAWVSGSVPDQKISIVLNYGADTDWVRNTLAAASAGVIRKGKHYKLIRPSIIPADSPDLAKGARVSAMLADWALIATLVPAESVP